MLGFGTLSGFAADYFSESQDFDSPAYNQHKEEHHLDNFILSLAEIEEIEEETGDEKQDLLSVAPLVFKYSFYFRGKYEIHNPRISYLYSLRYAQKTSLIYQLRNIRI